MSTEKKSTIKVGLSGAGGPDLVKDGLLLLSPRASCGLLGRPSSPLFGGCRSFLGSCNTGLLGLFLQDGGRKLALVMPSVGFDG